MDFAVSGIRLFGKFIIPAGAAPIEPPDQPHLELHLAPPVKKEDDDEPGKRVITRLILKFNGKRLPCPLISPSLRSLLRSMEVSRDHSPSHVITRTLHVSDVKKGLARLTIPRSKTLERFLSDEEEKLLEERDEEGQLKRLEVAVVDPLLVVRVLNLVRWNYKKPANPNTPPRSWSYVLNGGWTDIVDCNRLAAGDTIQVWSFRRSHASLGFIVFKL